MSEKKKNVEIEEARKLSMEELSQVVGGSCDSVGFPEPVKVTWGQSGVVTN